MEKIQFNLKSGVKNFISKPVYVVLLIIFAIANPVISLSEKDASGQDPAPESNTSPTIQKEESEEKSSEDSKAERSMVNTNESSSKIHDLEKILEERKKTVNDSKEKLVEIINESVADIIEKKETLKEEGKDEDDKEDIRVLRDELIKNIDSSLLTSEKKENLIETINESVTDIVERQETQKREDDNENKDEKDDKDEIHVLRDELIKNVDSSLSIPATVTSEDIDNLKTEINKGIETIGSTVIPSTTIISKMKDTSLRDIATTLDLLSEAVSNQTESLRKQEADLLYKDSNQDGISDYDSMYVYNIDPVLPSPNSVYNGKVINAGDKVLLGFDPALSEITTTINKEQPLVSEARVVLTYKVKEVALTEKKEILFSGQALPNSFITLYIYSTPIIVTVKTDSKGEWQYTLDKELENGDHTIYTATVNNSGNIIAKSSPYVFTKTAEAASLKDVPLMVSTEANEPGLFTGNYFYVVMGVIVVIIMIILILIGITSNKNKENI